MIFASKWQRGARSRVLPSGGTSAAPLCKKRVYYPYGCRWVGRQTSWSLGDRQVESLRKRAREERGREQQRNMAPCAVPDGAFPEPELVCVTGASGHLGTWLVMRLLEKGYRVRATVRDPDDIKKTAILRKLPGAEERLQLVRGQLLEEGGFDDAVYGCDGVFHCASPTEFSFEDPYRDCIEPAVAGTVNVLKSCSKAPTIKRIVFASSAAAARFTQLEDIPGQRFDESCWTDEEMCVRDKPHGWPYFLSKTLSEKKAFELAKEYNLDLVTILPTLVTGPFLIDKLPNSVADALSLVTGDKFHHKFIRRISYVHIDDIIDAHIFLYETPEAEGRYIGSCVDASITEVAEVLKKIYPKIKLPDNFDYVGEIVPHYMDNSKLKKLGFEFKHDLADMLESCVKCCVEKGLISDPGQES